MKHYAVALLDITDPSWLEDYAAKVTKIVERMGGRYLARTGDLARIEGEGRVPQVIVLLEFPSKEIAEEFYNCEEYRPHLAARKAGSKGSFFLLAAKDDTQQASTLND